MHAPLWLVLWHNSSCSSPAAGAGGRGAGGSSALQQQQQQQNCPLVVLLLLPPPINKEQLEGPLLQQLSPATDRRWSELFPQQDSWGSSLF